MFAWAESKKQRSEVILFYAYIEKLLRVVFERSLQYMTDYDNMSYRYHIALYQQSSTRCQYDWLLLWTVYLSTAHFPNLDQWSFQINCKYRTNKGFSLKFRPEGFIFAASAQPATKNAWHRGSSHTDKHEFPWDNNIQYEPLFRVSKDYKRRR